MAAQASLGTAPMNVTIVGTGNTFRSAGELIQSVAPDGVAVVKAFNTMFAVLP
jgi:predicted dinucleotide-binding enzyme